MSIYAEPSSYMWPHGLEFAAANKSPFPHKHFNLNLINQTFGYLDTDLPDTQSWALGKFDGSYTPVITDSSDITSVLDERAEWMLEQANSLYECSDIMGINASLSFIQIARHVTKEGSDVRWDNHAVIITSTPENTFRTSHDGANDTRLLQSIVLPYALGKISAGHIALERNDFIAMTDFTNTQEVHKSLQIAHTITDATTTLLASRNSGFAIGIRIL